MCCSDVAHKPSPVLLFDQHDGESAVYSRDIAVDQFTVIQFEVNCLRKVFIKFLKKKNDLRFNICANVKHILFLFILDCSISFRTQKPIS